MNNKIVYMDIIPWNLQNIQKCGQ